MSIFVLTTPSQEQLLGVFSTVDNAHNNANDLKIHNYEIWEYVVDDPESNRKVYPPSSHADIAAAAKESGYDGSYYLEPSAWGHRGHRVPSFAWAYQRPWYKR